MNTSPNGSGPAASPAKFAHWRQQTDVVQDAAAMRDGTENFTGGDVPEQVHAGQVSEGYFRLLGARPLLGRTFSADEDRPNGARVAVISYGWWTRRFASDQSIIGKTIQLGGDPYTGIGVIARGFDPSEFGDLPDVWTPFQLDPNSTDQGHCFMAGARLKPGVSLAQAQARLRQSAEAFRTKFPNALGKKQSFSVEPIQDVFIRNSRSILMVLLAAVTRLRMVPGVVAASAACCVPLEGGYGLSSHSRRSRSPRSAFTV